MTSWGTRNAFKERVTEWARKLDVSPRSLTVRPMKTKWASCSMSGALTFNEDLLRLDRDLSDYVIVHELLHFSVRNHGRLWKSLLRAHLGAYEESENKLRDLAGTTMRPG